MPLTLYPAMDLLDGRCVRLRTVDDAPTQVADDDPVEVARRWRDAGAEWLHLVDLNGALAGKPTHLAVVAAIAEATGLPIQLGGGLRSEDDVAAAFDAGAARVVLATAAAHEPELLAGCLARWNERIAVSVDARGGQVTAGGWLEVLSEPALGFARRMAQVGVCTLVVTNIERGATPTGGTVHLTQLRASLPSTRLIAAGNLATLEDLRWLIELGFDGIVVGRPLHEGTLDLAEALRLARASGARQDEPVASAE
jgi:phosphoribosylformimino-5-aminoimidazole carboxamide ribotide isomerase